MILLGAELSDLKEFANGAESAVKWNATDAELIDYRNAALKLIEIAAPRDKAQALARHLLQRRVLYARAIEGADWGTALSIAKDEAKLLGLYDLKEPDEAEGEGEKLTEAEIIKRLGEVADRIGGDRGRTIIAQIAGDTGTAEPVPAVSSTTKTDGSEGQERIGSGSGHRADPVDNQPEAPRVVPSFTSTFL